MRSKIILYLPLLLLSACASIGLSDTKETAGIVRQICPDVVVLSPEFQDELADLIVTCINPDAKLTVLEKNLCSDVITIMSQYEVSRDQSRICYNQK